MQQALLIDYKPHFNAIDIYNMTCFSDKGLMPFVRKVHVQFDEKPNLLNSLFSTMHEYTISADFINVTSDLALNIIDNFKSVKFETIEPDDGKKAMNINNRIYHVIFATTSHLQAQRFLQYVHDLDPIPQQQLIDLNDLGLSVAEDSVSQSNDKSCEL